LRVKKIIRDYYIERASKSAYELEKITLEHADATTVSSVVDCAAEKKTRGNIDIVGYLTRSWVLNMKTTLMVEEDLMELFQENIQRTWGKLKGAQSQALKPKFPNFYTYKN